MQLKVKFLNLSAGRPVAVLHKHFAERNALHVDDRILIRKNGSKIIAVVDIATGMLSEDEIVLSTEVSDFLKLKEGDLVYIEPAFSPKSIPLISKKLKCKTLSYSEIKNIMKDIVDNALTESEIAYFISAVYKCGMSMEETIEMVRAIVNTGKKLNLKNKMIADKHCLPFNTPVMIKENGEIKLVSIGDLVERIKAGGEDAEIKVLSWDDNYNVSFVSIISYYKVESPRKLIKITLKGNRDISMTGEHTIFTLKGGNVVNISSKEIKKGDYVLVPSGFSEVAESNSIKLTFEKESRKDKHIRKEIKITNELLRFLGYYVAEGFVNYQGIFLNFGSHEKELISDSVHCIKQVFGITPTINKPHKTATRVCIYSQELSKSFRKYFGLCDFAENKEIPSFIFKLNKDMSLEFVRALFRGDGYVRRGYEAVYVTVSKNLASQLSYLLSSKGISASVSTKKEGTREFPNTKNKICKTKRAYYIYTQAREIFGGRMKDNVAFINLLPIKELGEIEKEKIGWEFRKELKRQKYITKQKLSRIIGYISSEDVKKIINSNLSVLEVKKAEVIDSDSEYVYDLKTINGRFVAGFMPICIHNSIGGVPGRTTPVVISICAAAGLIMPKTSSRAITTPSGTADALEVICKVDFTIPEIKKIVNKTGACMVWGGSLGLAPADDRIIQVERRINIDPEAQLIASIMSKKLAVGSKYILIEIPYGKHAKVTKSEAISLQKKFKSLAKKFNVKLECVLIETVQPLGNGIGPALEIKDVISVLKRESSGFMLEKRALILSGMLLELTHKAKKGKGFKMAKEILDSGSAFNKFKQIILAQKGNLNHIPEAKNKKQILSVKDGKISEMDIKKINSMARLLGCPADKYSGIYLHKHIKEKVKKGERILTLYSESNSELNEAIKFYNKNKPISIK